MERVEMRVPDGVLDTVAYIGVATSEGPKYKGTGFFIGLPGEDEKGYWYHFVTAKHNVMKLDGQDFFLRVNTKDGSFATISGSGVEWHFHPESDVAVADIYLDSDVRFQTLRVEMFLDDAKIVAEDIGVGDDLVVVGLFSKRYGENRNIPIVRSGNLAAMASEPIPTKELGPIAAHLMELRSIGGLSGSPVFVVRSFPFAGERDWNIFLLGLLHGHWSLDQTEMDFASEPDLNGQQERVNTGIGIVIPAAHILETVYCPELTELRRLEDEKHRRTG